MACLWLATKVEEFNVSISQFVENLKESPQQSMRSEDLILALELPIISALKVRNPCFTLISISSQILFHPEFHFPQFALNFSII